MSLKHRAGRSFQGWWKQTETVIYPQARWNEQWCKVRSLPRRWKQAGRALTSPRGRSHMPRKILWPQIRSNRRLRIFREHNLRCCRRWLKSVDRSCFQLLGTSNLINTVLQIRRNRKYDAWRLITMNYLNVFTVLIGQFSGIHFCGKCLKAAISWWKHYLGVRFGVRDVTTFLSKQAIISPNDMASRLSKLPNFGGSKMVWPSMHGLNRCSHEYEQAN